VRRIGFQREGDIIADLEQALALCFQPKVPDVGG
jgi:hypothetical protein